MAGDWVVAIREPVGGYSELISVPAKQCYRLPDTMPFADPVWRRTGPRYSRLGNFCRLSGKPFWLAAGGRWGGA